MNCAFSRSSAWRWWRPRARRIWTWSCSFARARALCHQLADSPQLLSGIGWVVLVSCRAVRTEGGVRRRRSALHPGRARTRTPRCVWSRTGRSGRPCSSRESWRQRACNWNKVSDCTNEKSTTTWVCAPDFPETSACSAVALRPTRSGISAIRTRRCGTFNRR